MSDSTGPKPSEDILDFLPRLANKLTSLWLCWTYPFISVERDVFAHWSCKISRNAAKRIKIGKAVEIDRHVRLEVATEMLETDPAIWLDDGSVLGRFTTISAANHIYIGRDVIFGPSVLVADHDDSKPALSGHKNEPKANGSVRIEQNCWLGFGSAIVANGTELVIGRHSVIGANCLIDRSIPPYSVVAGNPSRIVKQYDPSQRRWVLGSSRSVGEKLS